MKKHLGILVIVLIAGIMGSGFFFWQSEASGNRIQFEEVTIKGDKEKASDIEITGVIRYISEMYAEYNWDFTFSPEDNTTKVSKKKKISHDISEVKNLKSGFAYASTYILKDLRGLCEYDYDNETGIIPYEDPDSVKPELRKAAEAMLDFRNSSKYTEIYKLNDLIDYYPMFNEFTDSYGDSFVAREEKEEKMEAYFAENFRIPVSDDMKIILMRDDTIEDRFTMFYGKEGSDAYEPQTVYCRDKENYYYSFTTHTRDGKVVDTGELTLGYGIYKAKLIKNEKGEIVPDFDNTELFIPLDPEVEIKRADISDSGDLYYIYEQEEKDSKTAKYVLADINTGKTIADFSFAETEINEYAENQNGVLMQCDYMGKLSYIFIPKTSENSFGEPVILEGSLENSEIDIYNADFYSDGEKTVIAGNAGSGDFGVAVYEKGKPVFYGTYLNSVQKPYKASGELIYTMVSGEKIKVKSK